MGALLAANLSAWRRQRNKSSQACCATEFYSHPIPFRKWLILHLYRFVAVNAFHYCLNLLVPFSIRQERFCCSTHTLSLSLSLSLSLCVCKVTLYVDVFRPYWWTSKNFIVLKQHQLDFLFFSLYQNQSITQLIDQSINQSFNY